jgi:hypothetical protein
MERLDHHEYKCTHCGAITVVSDDDADQLESMLGDFLKGAGSGSKNSVWASTSSDASRNDPLTVKIPMAGGAQTVTWQSGSDTGYVKSAEQSPATGTAAQAPIEPHFGRVWVFLGWVVGLVILYSFDFGFWDGSKHLSDTVPAETLILQNRFSMDGSEVATLRNTSNKPINLIPMTMTSYKGDFKKDTSQGTVGVTHLLPNEHTLIFFPVSSGADADRFKFSTSGPLPISTESLPHLQLMEAKLLHVAGTHHYQLAGVVQNPLKYDLQSGSIALTLFNANYEIIGWARGNIKDLEPKEKAVVAIDFEVDESHGQIASYEYLIDVVQSPVPNG